MRKKIPSTDLSNDRKEEARGKNGHPVANFLFLGERCAARFSLQGRREGEGGGRKEVHMKTLFLVLSEGKISRHPKKT